MDDTRVQQKIIELARKAGLDYNNLSRREYMVLSLRARETFREKAEAVGAAAASRLRTTLLRLRVLPEVAAGNEKFCRESCPSGLFKILRDGTPACEGCGCSGPELESKWHDPKAECPRKHWSNHGQPTSHPPDIILDGTLESPDLTATRK